MNTTAPTGLLQQPRPFFMIFFVELWERFGYYGVQGILAVFFVKQLGFSQEQAFITFGAFAALVYGLISIGGYVGDHLLGTKRTLVLGAIVLAIGYFMTGMSLLKPQLIFIALGTIAVGNGLFKANPASLLSKCYPPKDARLDGAFTLFYMSINIGSLLSLSLAPVIAEKFGYAVTYNLCGAGLIIALLVYFACRGMVKDIGSEPDHRPLSLRNLALVLAGTVVMIFLCAWLMHNVMVANLVLIVLSIVVIAFFFREAFRLDKTGRNKMFVAFILMIEAVLFYILYAQMPTSLNFFAINNVHHEILGFTINPVSFQALNPFWVVVASPVLAAIYTPLGHKGKDPTMPGKFTLGVVARPPGLPARRSRRDVVCRRPGINLAVVYCAGLSVPEPGRTADQRPGAGDGCRTGAAASDGLYSGDVVSDPGRRVPAGRLCGDLHRSAGKHYRSAADLAGLYQCVQ